MNTSINSTNYKTSYGYNSPSFGAIKSVECFGYYKKFPQYAQDLVDTFKNNKEAMDFCKKYNVDILVGAIDSGFRTIQTFFTVFVDNIAKGKLRKFFDSLSGKQDKVVIYGFGNAYNRYESLMLATENLKIYISPKSGVINSHLDLKDKEIQEILSKKLAKKQLKDNKKKLHAIQKTDEIRNSKSLKSAIDDLKDKSK